MSKVGPDSRRSWIVAVSCFFVQVLTFGLTEASGLLFVATIPRFKATREQASLPFTLVYCVRSAIGPLCGYLGQRFGIRNVTLIGCIASPIAVGVCFLADDIASFIILWGIVFGISLGLETSLINVILNEHFVKHRVRANGLNISGASLGTLLLSPLIEHSVEEYGLSGTFLIISGLMLNSIPAVIVMLFNEPLKEIPEIPYVTKEKSKKTVNDSAETISQDKAIQNSTNHDKLIKIIEFDNLCKISSKRNSEISVVSLNSSQIIDVTQLRNAQADPDCHRTTHVHSVSKHWIKNVIPTLPTWHSKSNQIQYIDIPITDLQFHSSFSDNTSMPEKLPSGISPERSSGVNSCEAENDCRLSVSSAHTLSKAVVQAPSKGKLQRLCFNPVYLFLVIGSGIYYFSITTFLTIIVDYATDIGISVTFSTYIVMWIAVSDMCGYFCLSPIIERGYVCYSKFAAFSYVCMCLTSAAMVWSTSYIMLLILITIFEFGQCGVIVLSAPLVGELIDDDLQAPAIASVTFLSAPITMAISPLIGFFRDGEGSYDGVFYVISGLTLFCCLLFLCIPKLDKIHKNKRYAS